MSNERTDKIYQKEIKKDNSYNAASDIYMWDSSGPIRKKKPGQDLSVSEDQPPVIDAKQRYQALRAINEGIKSIRDAYKNERIKNIIESTSKAIQDIDNINDINDAQKLDMPIDQLNTIYSRVLSMEQDLNKIKENLEKLGATFKKFDNSFINEQLALPLEASKTSQANQLKRELKDNHGINFVQQRKEDIYKIIRIIGKARKFLNEDAKNSKQSSESSTRPLEPPKKAEQKNQNTQKISKIAKGQNSPNVGSKNSTTHKTALGANASRYQSESVKDSGPRTANVSSYRVPKAPRQPKINDSKPQPNTQEEKTLDNRRQAFSNLPSTSKPEYQEAFPNLSSTSKPEYQEAFPNLSSTSKPAENNVWEGASDHSFASKLTQGTWNLDKHVSIKEVKNVIKHIEDGDGGIANYMRYNEAPEATLRSLQSAFLKAHAIDHTVKFDNNNQVLKLIFSKDIRISQLVDIRNAIHVAASPQVPEESTKWALLCRETIDMRIRHKILQDLIETKNEQIDGLKATYATAIIRINGKHVMVNNEYGMTTKYRESGQSSGKESSFFDYPAERKQEFYDSSSDAEVPMVQDIIATVSLLKQQNKIKKGDELEIDALITKGSCNACFTRIQYTKEYLKKEYKLKEAAAKINYLTTPQEVERQIGSETYKTQYGREGNAKRIQLLDEQILFRGRYFTENV